MKIDMEVHENIQTTEKFNTSRFMRILVELKYNWKK